MPWENKNKKQNKHQRSSTEKQRLMTTTGHVNPLKHYILEKIFQKFLKYNIFILNISF